MKIYWYQQMSHTIIQIIEVFESLLNVSKEELCK